ncbi:MAG: ABC transporter ATP-binding protein, partial [Acidimicrobiia bacterium]
MLQTLGLTKRYGATTALDTVDLTVAAEETVAVLGPSGSGKSTLLRLIAGLDTPDSGTISWEGTDLTSVPVHARRFGLMFQDYALFPHRDIAGNVGFGLRMAGRSQREVARRVDEVLELVGLPGTGRRRIDQL